MSNYYNESHEPTAKEIAVEVQIAKAALIQKRIDALIAEQNEKDA